MLKKLFERVEFKYWVSLAQVREVQRFAEGLLEPDLAGGAHDQRNVSLYLDTPELTFLANHEAERPDRFKLRVRRYGRSSAGPVFLEIKRKVKHVIVKKRAALAPADLPAVLAQATPLPKCADRAHLEEFSYLHSVSQAEPVVLVACNRLAYKAADPLDEARLTIDRDIVYQPWRGEFFDLDERADVPIDGEEAHGRPTRAALLELKFGERAPEWMAALVTRFGLQRTNYSKYCAAVRHEFGQRYRAPEWGLSPFTAPARPRLEPVWEVG